MLAVQKYIILVYSASISIFSFNMRHRRLVHVAGADFGARSCPKDTELRCDYQTTKSAQISGVDNYPVFLS
jgi:hypothetical protein